MFKLWSAEELPGETQAIITTLLIWFFVMKESRRIKVSFEARKGTWSALSSIALMHYLRASKLYNFIYTFYWSLLLPFVFGGCCSGYLGLVRCRPNLLKPVCPQHLHYFSSLEPWLRLHYVANCMWTGASIICYCCMSSSIRIGLLHNCEEFLRRLCILLSQPWYLNTTIFVFQNVQYCFLVEEIKASTSVNLEIAYCHSVNFFHYLV